MVTVEVGPEGRRVWLTLGVSPQSITCLHCADANTLAGADCTSQVESNEMRGVV